MRNFWKSRHLCQVIACASAATVFTSLLNSKNSFSTVQCSGITSSSRAPSCVATIEKWGNVTIVFQNKEEFDRKLDLMASGGKKKLQVIADFDFTMTKFYNNQRQRSYSCHSLIEGNQYVSDEYRKLATGLLHYYYPIEVSTTLTVEQKIPYMIEWVNRAHDLMVERSGLRQSMIKLAVSEALESKNISFRDGVSDFLKNLDQHGIPILIFSAGLGDVIEELLKQYCHNGTISSHLHIVSNHMIFKDDHLIGFTSPSYHVFNKTAQSALHSPFFQHHDLLHRTNLILLGDSLGDIAMSNGLSFHEDSCLKIGFLNEKPERLPDYLSVYDVVILGDPGYEVPNEILKKILEERRK